MSEEEKEAINNLNFIIVTDVYDNEVKIDKTKIVNEYNESVGIVLNLISNLQKENEELENKIDTLIDEQEEREKYTHNLEGKILILQKELDKKDICLKTCEESLTKERQERIKLDKVIEEMGIALMHNKNSRFYNMTLAEVEQYFYKKAEE